jgi:hypothetical protein
MSNFTPNDRPQAAYEEMGQGIPPRRGALSFLIQDDPEAIIEVELVDHPLDLPQDQFEALLFESECEV